MENGRPSTSATTSRRPSASNTRISPASQSHIQNRPSCHRGDSPICSPVAKISAIARRYFLLRPGAAEAADAVRYPRSRADVVDQRVRNKGVRMGLLLGTRKGVFFLDGDADRSAWTPPEPHFLGHIAQHVMV